MVWDCNPRDGVRRRGTLLCRSFAPSRMATLDASDPILARMGHSKTNPRLRTKTRSAAPDNLELAELSRELDELLGDMLHGEAVGLASHPGIDPSYDLSARNLLHYLALRAHDLRGLQQRLARLGLSSLGRCEAHALATTEAVREVIAKLGGARYEPRSTAGPRVDFGEGDRVLARHATSLLGPARVERGVRILVTMPDEAADDPALVQRWIGRGMDAARINCAHGDAAQWERMIANVRRASKRTGRACRVFMDLAGPKLRTGPLEPAAAVLRVKPERDELGRVVTPASVWLTAVEAPTASPAGCDATLTVERAWLASLAPGDRIDFSDTRGARREFEVLARRRGGVLARTPSTSYITQGLALRKRGVRGAVGATRIGPIEPRPGEIRLGIGDRLTLTRSLEPGRPALLDSRGRMLSPARIGCTLADVFDHVRVGESVWLDDGKIGCVVRSAGSEQLELEVLSARAAGCKLRADKGVNLPDTNLETPAFTEKDRADLPFVVEHADVVALSFVHAASDVHELEQRLAELGRPELGIVLKIETRRAFERLPQLLLAAMRRPCSGVMIARGDLAVECGFERLAEVQEEILWLCEAAHTPVIWATQVLETMAREGRPSRAEITDAAMGERAECVMLNKGPHLDQALTALDDILRRMEGHQHKKSAMLRPLGLARRPIE